MTKIETLREFGMTNEAICGMFRSLMNKTEKVFKIVATKKDGTERTFYATTNLGMISRVNGRLPKESRETVSMFFRVFDLSVNDWRSFYMDKVISYEEISFEDAMVEIPLSCE